MPPLSWGFYHCESREELLGFRYSKFCPFIRDAALGWLLLTQQSIQSPMKLCRAREDGLSEDLSLQGDALWRQGPAVPPELLQGLKPQAQVSSAASSISRWCRQDDACSKPTMDVQNSSLPTAEQKRAGCEPCVSSSVVPSLTPPCTAKNHPQLRAHGRV